MKSTKTKIEKPNASSNFVPLNKSFLMLQFFTASSSLLNKPVNVKYDASKAGFKFLDFENIMIEAPYMTLDFDFLFFIYLVKKFVNSGFKDIEFTYEDLFSKANMNVDRRNFPHYRVKVAEALKKYKSVDFSFTRNGHKTPSSMSLVSDYIASSDDSSYRVKFGYGISFLYNIDSSVITNLDPAIYKKIKGSFAKILYLVYICNNINYKNYFTVEMLKMRLQSNSSDEAETNRSIKNAHKQLKDLKLIKSFEEIKGGSGKETVSYMIIMNKQLTKKGKAGETAETRKKDKALENQALIAHAELIENAELVDEYEIEDAKQSLPKLFNNESSTKACKIF